MREEEKRDNLRRKGRWRHSENRERETLEEKERTTLFLDTL